MEDLKAWTQIFIEGELKKFGNENVTLAVNTAKQKFEDKIKKFDERIMDVKREYKSTGDEYEKKI